VRTDGSKIDFSWKICLDAKLPSLRSDVLFALREAIALQTMEFKGRMFAGQPLIPCALTGALVAIDKCHVDHIAPDSFENLVERWLETEGLSYEEVRLGASPDGYSKQMIDPLQRAGWRQFHQQHAKLRILSTPAHLSLPRPQQQ
jgi:hypothetical protein